VKNADVLLCHVVHQIQQNHDLNTATYLFQHELQFANFLSGTHNARNRTVRSITFAVCHQSHTSIRFALGHMDHRNTADPCSKSTNTTRTDLLKRRGPIIINYDWTHTHVGNKTSVTYQQ